MFQKLSSLLSKRSTLHAEMGLDHLELSNDSLIMGMQVAWYNRTSAPIHLQQVVLYLYNQGKKEAPLELSYNSRFVRIPFQKAITKIAGSNSFYIGPGASQVECLRFMTRTIRDLPIGTYQAELHSVVEEGSYIHDFAIKIAPELKSQAPTSVADAAQPGAAASPYSRALRFGV